MRLLDIFNEKETTPESIVEIAVFSLGSETDLFILSGHLGKVFGNPAWEYFASRRSLFFILDEGKVADEIPYKLTVRIFEDGGGFVRLYLDLSNHKFDLDKGILWYRREFSSALTRFLEAVLETADPEALKHAPGSDDALRRLGLEPERIGGELDFGFAPGSRLIKVGQVPKDGRILRLSNQVVLQDGVFFMKSADEEVLTELARWCYREGVSSWHLYSLRRWLERINESAGSVSKGYTRDFARFLRRVNRFILRERRFFSGLLDISEIEPVSEFSLLARDFDPTSKRLSELFSSRQEEVVTAALEAMEKLSVKQERLFAAWVVLLGAAGLFFGILELLSPGHPWLWIVGSSILIVLPLTAYLLWARLSRRPVRSIGDEVKLVELERRVAVTQDSISLLERSEKVPDQMREELLVRRRRELRRLERLLEDERAALNNR